MGQLLVWLAVCGVLALLLRSRPVPLCCLAILLWIAVPAVAGYRITGEDIGTFALHPATWLILVAFAVQLVTAAPIMLGVPVRHPLVVLTVVVFGAAAFLTSRVTGSGGTRLLVDQVAGPFAMWWLIVAYADLNRRRLLLVRNTVLFAAVVESCLAVAEKLAGGMLVYQSDYFKYYWYKPDRTFDRWFGSTDSPLVLTLLLCVSGGLALGIRNWALRYAVLASFVVGTLVTQSRTGTALLCLIIVYSIVRGQMALWARLATSAMVVVAGIYLASSSFATGIADRLVNDTGSFGARVAALHYIGDHWTDFITTGQGLTASYDIARSAGLASSIESSFFMYAIDVGLIFAVLYFGCQFAIVLKYGRQRAVTGITMAAALGAVMQHSFSAVATVSAAGTIVWTVLALVVVAWTISVRESAAVGWSPANAQAGLGGVPRSGAPAARRTATSVAS